MEEHSLDVSIFSHRSIVPAPAADVFRWHERPEALLDLIPSRRLFRIEHQSGGLRDGGRVVFSVGVGPVRLWWEARHFGYIPDVQFCDEQVRGPFRLWRHTHRFEALEPEETLYEDRIQYMMRGPRILRRLADPFLRLLLSWSFAQRHEIVRASFAGARAATA